MGNDASAFEYAFNSRNWVPDFDTHLQRWADDSYRVRVRQSPVEVAYGPSAAERMDVYPAERPGAPVLVFVHGGFWRSLAKRDFSFVAPAFTARQVCVVVPNYALCPVVSVQQIVAQVRTAVGWTLRHIAAYGGDPARIVVSGHSAGGHLAAMMLCQDWAAYSTDRLRPVLPSVLALSAIYDLRTMRQTPSLQASLGLSELEAVDASPVLRPPPAQGRLHAVIGERESPAFWQQAQEIRAAWGESAVPLCRRLPSKDHLSIVDALAEPGTELHALAMGLLIHGDAGSLVC